MSSLSLTPMLCLAIEQLPPHHGPFFQKKLQKASEGGRSEAYT